MIRYLRLILAIPLFLVAMACSTNPTVANGGDPELEAKARAALQQLFDSTPKAKDLQYQAKAVVVFPDIVKAGLLVGAQGGKGVMFGPDGKVLGYYRARGAFIRVASRRTNLFGGDVFHDRLGNHRAHEWHRIVRWCGTERRGGGCGDGQVDDHYDYEIRCLCVHFWPAGLDGRSGRSRAENC